MPVFVYVLRCADGSLYTGWTTDIGKRLRAHRASRASKYTRSRLPVEVAGIFSVGTRTEARRLEAKLKLMPRAQKLEAIMDESYRARPVQLADLNDISEHRRRMFSEAGISRDGYVPSNFRTWLEPRLRDGRYLGWIVEQGTTKVAGIGVMLLDWPPHPNHPHEGQRGYIFNLFVEPEHRRKGIAKHLMQLAYEAARSRGVSYLTLHATEQGRPLYESDGWKITNEMSLKL